MTARLTANKISPLNTWKINLDAHVETFEEEFEYETRIFSRLKNKQELKRKKTVKLKVIKTLMWTH